MMSSTLNRAEHRNTTSTSWATELANSLPMNSVIKRILNPLKISSESIYI